MDFDRHGPNGLTTHQQSDNKRPIFTFSEWLDILSLEKKVIHIYNVTGDFTES